MLFAKIIEAMMSFVIELKSQQSAKLLRHKGKAIQITVRDLETSFFLIIQPEKIYVYSYYTEVPDTRIQGSLLSLLQQALTSSQVSKLSLEGDIELAQDLQFILQQSDIDWAEYLSFILGDLATNQVVKSIKGLQQSFRIHQKRGLEDIRDYLQEEKRFFPTYEETEDFYEEIASLRNTVDRLEARLDRLMEMES